MVQLDPSLPPAVQQINLKAKPLNETLSNLLSTLYDNPQVPYNVVDAVFQGLRHLMFESIVPKLTEIDFPALKSETDDSFRSLR